MQLLQDLTLESYMDDMQYVMTLSSRGEVGGKPVSELHEYLDQRYSPEFVGAILRLLVSCQSWVSRNWEEMQEVGLVANGGVVNILRISWTVLLVGLIVIMVSFLKISSTLLVG